MTDYLSIAEIVDMSVSIRTASLKYQSVHFYTILILTSATAHKITQFSCIVSTRQSELLPFRASHDSPTYLQDCTIFLTQLNYVYNETKFKNKIRCYHFKLNYLTTLWPNMGNSTSSELTLHSNFSKFLVLMLHRQVGSHFLGTRDSYGPTAQHIQKTIYM